MSQDDKESAPQSMWDKIGKSETPKLVVNNPKPPYVAFETKDRLLGFTLHCPSVKLAHSFYYPHLLTTTVHEPEYDFVVLTTSTSIIRITGRDLQPIVSALDSHTCKAVWEYSKELYLPPAEDDGKPYIEKIEVALIKGAGDNPQGAAGKKREEA